MEQKSAKHAKKKASDRRHVNINIQRVTRNGREYITHTLSWTPPGGTRQRKSIGDAADAEAEANRIEKLLRKGLDGVAEIGREHFAAYAAFREQYGDVPLRDILRFYVDSASNGLVTSSRAELIGSIDKKSTLLYDFLQTRLTNDFSPRHQTTIKHHLKYFGEVFQDVDAADLNEHPERITNYLTEHVGGAPKTRLQHLITIRTLFTWMRDAKKVLPYRATGADLVKRPNVVNGEHEIYKPNEIMRLLAAAQTGAVMFVALGQFAGFRASERMELRWEHWRKNEGNKIVALPEVTKTKKRRSVDVLPSMESWLNLFKGEPGDYMVELRSIKPGAEIANPAGIVWLHNALRSGFASYHLELFDNAALTAKNDGHSVDELETDYKSISGVTKEKARIVLNGITPKVVLKFAHENKLPKPAWAHLVK